MGFWLWFASIGMNELKEYYCYVSKDAITASTKNGELQERKYDSKCSQAGQVWNAVAGVCAKVEAPEIEYFPTSILITDSKKQSTC